MCIQCARESGQVRPPKRKLAKPPRQDIESDASEAARIAISRKGCFPIENYLEA